MGVPPGETSRSPNPSSRSPPRRLKSAAEEPLPDPRPAIAALLLVACANTEDDEPCRAGFEIASDQHCYPPPTPWPEPDIHDALDTLPPCESDSPDGAIDVENGCASGACVHMPESEMSAALGMDPECTPASWSNTNVYCLWPSGIEGLFEDNDQNGWPDEDAPNDRIHLIPPYTGQTPDGSGVAVNVSCFIEDFGYPEIVVYYDVGGTLMVQDLIYDQYGLRAYDWGTDNETDSPDGRIDNVYLYGAP